MQWCRVPRLDLCTVEFYLQNFVIVEVEAKTAAFLHALQVDIVSFVANRQSIDFFFGFRAQIKASQIVRQEFSMKPLNRAQKDNLQVQKARKYYPAFL